MDLQAAIVAISTAINTLRDELTATIAEVNPQESWITHGSEDGLLRWCELHQRKARALHLVGRDLEEEA